MLSMKWIKDSVLFHIFLLILAVAVGYGSFRMGRQALQAYRESIVNQKKIAELNKKKEELVSYLKQLQAPGAVEREAKSRLNLKLPGEEVVVVVAGKASSTIGQAEQAGVGVWAWITQIWHKIW